MYENKIDTPKLLSVKYVSLALNLIFYMDYFCTESELIRPSPPFALFHESAPATYCRGCAITLYLSSPSPFQKMYPMYPFLIQSLYWNLLYYLP